MRPSLVRLLETMLAAERAAESTGAWDEAEAMADGLEVWVGDKRFHWSTINEALWLVAVRDVSDDHGCRRFAISEVGKLLLRAPENEDAIRLAVLRGTGAWTVQGDRFVALTEER